MEYPDPVVTSQEKTWHEIKSKLRPGGRCIANLGKSELPMQLMQKVFAGDRCMEWHLSVNHYNL